MRWRGTSTKRTSTTAAKYPDWFKDEEEFQSEANAAEAPATKADISALGGNIVEAK